MENEIQPTIQPQTPVQLISPKPKFSFRSKWPLTILAAIIILSLPLGGFLLLVKLGIHPNPSTVTIKTTTSPTPASNAANATPTNTANWKTYITSNYSIEYPSNWFYNSYFAYMGGIRCVDFSDTPTQRDSPNEVSLVGHSIIQMCSYIGGGSSISDLYNASSGFIKNINTIQPFSINRNKGIKAQDPSVLGGIETLAFLENPGSTKGFVKLANETGDIKIFNQMVSTFKFAQTVEDNDGPASWTMYKSEKGKFEIEYPLTWKQPVNKEGCGSDFFDRALYLGPDDKSVLVCQSSYTGQVYVISTEGDKRTNSSYNLSTGFANIHKQDITVSGIVGQRIEGNASGQWGEGALEDGTKKVNYIFYIHNRTYIASYIGTPHDVLADFDLMIKTLKFTQ